MCVQECVQRVWIDGCEKKTRQNGNNRKSLNCKMVRSVGCKVVKSNLSLEYTWPSMFRWLSDTKCSGNLCFNSSFVAIRTNRFSTRLGLEVEILILLCALVLDRFQIVGETWLSVQDEKFACLGNIDLNEIECYLKTRSRSISVFMRIRRNCASEKRENLIEFASFLSRVFLYSVCFESLVYN